MLHYERPEIEVLRFYMDVLSGPTYIGPEISPGDGNDFDGLSTITDPPDEWGWADTPPPSP